MTETRPDVADQAEATGQATASGDAVLDTLLREAVRLFRDPVPSVRQTATEKLWDVWERLKTLDTANKKQGVATLIALAVPETAFQEVLNSEARALTAIGDDFHIRHFETNRVPLSHPTQYDYLFRRLYALIHLLLGARAAQRPGG